MERNQYPLVLLAAVLAALMIGLVGGVLIDRQVFPLINGYTIPATGVSSEGLDMGLIQEAWNTVNKIYVDRSAVKPKDLTYGAISGMVDALGDTGHSRFLTPQMVAEENSFTQGEFEGIGVEVQIVDGELTVVAPIDGSPAQKAGIQAGDVIQKVNGEDISGQPLNDMISKIKGPAGTSVNLTIFQPKQNVTRTVSVERARIPLHNVDWQEVPGSTIAHVRISAFTKDVGKELTQALKEAQSKQVTGVVLDLRNNPGGLLDEAVATASQFLANGNVMKEKDASGNTKGLPVKPGGVATKIPLVVLINNGSASASEIVAGAIQDAGRGKLVGETTFGTGTVLNQFNLSDGSALLLATEEWLTPSGRVIWHKGIDPDVKVSLPTGVTLLSPVSEENMTATQVAASQDTQLLKALEILGQPMAVPTGQPTAAPTVLPNAVSTP